MNDKNSENVYEALQVFITIISCREIIHKSVISINNSAISEGETVACCCDYELGGCE